MFSAQFIGDIHAEEMPAPSDKWNRVETAAERPDLIVWHMNLLGVNLKPLLTGAPKASVLVVSRPLPDPYPLQARIARCPRRAWPAPGE